MTHACPSDLPDLSNYAGFGSVLSEAHAFNKRFEKQIGRPTSVQDNTSGNINVES